MRLKFKLQLLIAILAASSTPAFAEDWSGLYVGGELGYSFTSVNLDQSKISTATNLASDFRNFSDEPSGYSGGVHVGFQKQLGMFVLGFEGSYTALDVDDFGHTSLNDGNSTRTAEISDMFAVAARAGIGFGSTHAYGKIGYANAGVGFDNLKNSTGETLANYDERDSGLLLGMGAEFAVTENINIGIDYSYVNFNIDTKIQDLNIDGVRTAINENIDSDIHKIGIRLNFKFNGF